MVAKLSCLFCGLCISIAAEVMTRISRIMTIVYFCYSRRKAENEIIVPVCSIVIVPRVRSYAYLQLQRFRNALSTNMVLF
jgi:hypothetical protein